MQPPSKARLVVVGNGMAAMRTVEELLARASDRYDITIVGAEPYPNYNRILLSAVLAGEKTVDEIILNPFDWYVERGVRLIAGRPATAIDRAGKTVVIADGERVSYDKLLLATGSKPLAPAIPGLGLPGVGAFRDIGDVEAMIEAARRQRRAVVIGGGLLGLEAAWGLKRRGMSVAVVHLMPTLMERQLDIPAGELLQRDLDARGIAFFTDAQTEEIFGTERVEGIRLNDGREIAADLVVLAIGIRPNIDLARAADLAINRGIKVGDDLCTSDGDIYAVGECIEHNGQVFGLVAPIWEQAKICGARLAGDKTAAYVPPPVFTSLKITGVDVFSAGALCAADDNDDEITLHDAKRGMYKKVILRDNRIVGSVLYGSVADGPWYTQLMRDKVDVSVVRDQLVFGRAFAEHPYPNPPPLAGKGIGEGAPRIDIAAMADSEQVCGCNGISKGAICRAVLTNGLATLDAVRAYTKASASCGSCTGTVEAILTHLGTRAGMRNPDPPMCKCTEIGHDAVRQAIRAQSLTTIAAVREILGWKTPDGCHKCRPALNYYLLCAWPETYRDDPQSRFVNERVHANIQKDGTFSVVPRMWGGLTTPRELRAIADTAEKFAIPTVKVTGGQRIDLLGVRKEQLPAVWGELNKAGLVSGHAYGKALRTVKTCVGSEWCRFGTQDSTGLGVKIEKMCWGSWTPHKVKLAVSGCPRNCAEATIKDLGVVCVEAGYDVMVGGNGGVEVRVTDHLVRLATETEVLEHVGAFLQLYREEARYLERTAPWVARVGIDYVRRRMVEDADGRRALHGRFLISQRAVQTDPWAERAGGAAAHEYRVLAEVG
jgi:nitrite reductase (NADH) large subunit